MRSKILLILLITLLAGGVVIAVNVLPFQDGTKSSQMVLAEFWAAMDKEDYITARKLVSPESADLLDMIKSLDAEGRAEYKNRKAVTCYDHGETSECYYCVIGDEKNLSTITLVRARDGWLVQLEK